MSRIEEIKQTIKNGGYYDEDGTDDVEYLLSLLERAETVLAAIAGEELPFGAKLVLPPKEAAQEALRQLRS